MPQRGLLTVCGGASPGAGRRGLGDEARARVTLVSIHNAPIHMVKPPSSGDALKQPGKVPGPPRSMRIALNRIVLPALRARGFKGELPDLRRVSAEGTHFFNVQTNKYGGSFIVNLGRLPPGPFTTRSGELVPADLLSIIHARGSDEARLRAKPHPDEEVWFQYGQTERSKTWAKLRPLLGLGDPKPLVPEFERVAHELLALLPECDQWWAGADGLPHVRSSAEAERAQHEAWNNRPRRT